MCEAVDVLVNLGEVLVLLLLGSRRADRQEHGWSIC